MEQDMSKWINQLISAVKIKALTQAIHFSSLTTLKYLTHLMLGNIQYVYIWKKDYVFVFTLIWRLYVKLL